MKFWVGDTLIGEKKPMGYWCDACHLPLIRSGDKRKLNQSDVPEPHLTKCILCGRQAGRSSQIISASKFIWYVNPRAFTELANQVEIRDEEGNTYSSLKHFLQTQMQDVRMHIYKERIV